MGRQAQSSPSFPLRHQVAAFHPFLCAGMHNVTTNRQLAVCHGGYACEKTEDNGFAIAHREGCHAELSRSDGPLHSLYGP